MNAENITLFAFERGKQTLLWEKEKKLYTDNIKR